MKKYPLTRRDFKCDYPGCFLIPFAEVYPGKVWNYLCLFHFIQEMPRRDMGWTLAAWIYRLPGMRWLWNFYASRS